MSNRRVRTTKRRDEFAAWESSSERRHEFRGHSSFMAPFPYVKTQAQRLASGDPRLSLEERYGTQAGYVSAVTAAATDLVTRRFMLQADATAAIAAAAANPILP